MQDNLTLNLILHQPCNDGHFEGQYADRLATLSQARPSVILAFAPKAAGTYLRSAAVLAINGQLVRTVHAQGGRDAQFYLPIFLDYFRGGVTPNTLVTHVHMQALPGNRHLIEALSLKPIIMLRSVPDMLASFIDMLMRDETARREGLNCAIPHNFTAMSPEKRADFVVDMIAPWYASYYATWHQFAMDDPDRVFVARYSDFLAEPGKVLMAMLQHAGVPTPRSQCDAALQAIWQKREQLRYNKGIAGRSETYFSDSQLKRIRGLLRRFKSLEPWLSELR